MKIMSGTEAITFSAIIFSIFSRGIKIFLLREKKKMRFPKITTPAITYPHMAIRFNFYAIYCKYNNNKLPNNPFIGL